MSDNALLFTKFRSLPIIMEYEGTCGVCYNKLDKSHIGTSCCKCNQAYHLKCAKINNADQLASSPYVCQPCGERRSILRLLEKQQSEITKLSQSINTQIKTALEQFEENSIKPLQEKVSTFNNDINMVKREQFECKIVITGIPVSVNDGKDLRQVVMDIGTYYGLTVSPYDVMNCYWVKSNRKANKVVVKFSNLFVMKDLLKCYFGEKNLVVANIDTLGLEDITSRVYIEQLLPPAIERITLYCRKLKKSEIISKFYVDFKTGATKVTLNDETTLNFEDLKKLSEKFPIRTA